MQKLTMLKNIKHQIKESGVKQSFIAKQLKISTSMLSLVLSGERKLSDDKWQKLNTFLAVSRNYKELLSSNTTTNEQV
mgnify:CR=1 FL=1|tara:strand:- start:677 stop:910 length:234 start_codon:yes stop_codon:yes gene_type:complete